MNSDFMSLRKKIFLISPRGFCAGVVRAIGMLEEIVKNRGDRVVYVLHEIIHNKYVLDSFQRQGVIFVESLNEIQECREKCIIVLSAHGVSQEIQDLSNNISEYVIDATCPLVKKVHNEAKSIVNSGKELIIIGEKNHPEVIGINGMVSNQGYVIKDVEDVKSLDLNEIKGIDYVIQTTLNIDDIQIVIEAMQKKYCDVQSIKSLNNKKNVCYATKNRQDAIKYAIKNKSIDFGIIIGSKNSSNANSLLKLLEDNNITAIMIDSFSELDVDILLNAKNILISSAASTPEYLVQELTESISKTLSEFNIEVENIYLREENVEFKFKVAI